MVFAASRGEVRDLPRLLAEGAWACGEWLKREGAGGAWMGALNVGGAQRLLVVKQSARPGGLVGAARDVLAPSRAMRQVRGAALLEQAGVRTGRPALLLREARKGAAIEWLVLDWLPGEDLIEALGRRERSTSWEHALAARAGELARRLSEAGIFNRDHKCSNLIVGPDDEIGVVDTVGVRRSRRRDGLERMLASMLFEAAGTGLLPRRAILMRCARSACGDGAKEMWRRLSERLARAGDTTPAVDPRRGMRTAAPAAASTQGGVTSA